MTKCEKDCIEYEDCKRQGIADCNKCRDCIPYEEARENGYHDVH